MRTVCIQFSVLSKKVASRVPLSTMDVVTRYDGLALNGVELGV